MQNQSLHTTSKAHKGIPFRIFALIFLLGLASGIVLVHWGQKEFQTAGIIETPKQSDAKPCPAGITACGIGTAVTYTRLHPALRSWGQTEMYGPYRGIVDLAHDGDTVNIKLDLGFDISVYARVRVKGINAPELSTAAGKRARDFAQQVLPSGTQVLVNSYGWDKYGGRIDGTIAISYDYNGVEYDDFGHLMLASGNAVPYTG